MWNRLPLAVLLAVTSPTLAAPFAYTGTNVGDGGAEGLKLLFAEHGRNAEDITAALVGGELPLNGVKVLIIGSYANTGPALATLRARRDGLEKWVAAGGVLLELVQQDGGYPRSDWLPDGMLVSRADPDFDSVTWRRPDHPLATTPNRLDAAAMSGWQLKRWGIAWEALTSWDGFENILACGPRGERSALVEGSYGRGRVMVSVVSPDSMVTHGEGETPAKARLYFANLLHYLDELVAGRGVRLNPTPALGPVRGATTGRLRLALLAPPESPLAGQLARVGAAPSRVSMMVPTPATADVLLIDAGAAEELSAAAAAQVAAFAHAGGVVVELSQNQQQRPAWLPVDQRVRRGGFPADLLVPAVAEHPLFNSPNALVGARRSAWREGEQPLARPPFDATLGWGVVARFGGEQAPAAVVERRWGRGRVILVAADPAAAMARDDLAGDNARAFVANLVQFAAAAAWGQVEAVAPVPLPARSRLTVGRQRDGSVVVPSEQLLTPVGRQVEFVGRPTALALLPGGRLAVADRAALRVIDTRRGEVSATLACGGHAVTGLVASSDGRRLYSSTTKSDILTWRLEGSTLTAGPPIVLPGGSPAPTGLALSADEQTLYVGASRANAVLAVPLHGGEPRPLDVGVAPYGLLRVGERLFVSNWGGRRPREGERTAASSGTPVTVDQRTTATQGMVSVVDLGRWQVTAEIPVGLLPSGLCARPDGRRVYVTNANSDSVTVIDATTLTVVETIAVKPHAALPFGSGVNDLCLSADGATLYAACGTNNAVAVVALGSAAQGLPGEVASALSGFIPVGWYPGAVVVNSDGREICVANTKGVGSLAAATEHNSRDHQGSVSLVTIPGAEELAEWTRRTAENNRLSYALAGLQPPRPDAPPRALPERHGEPSLLKHVVYIIRENRTYDQVLGDLPQGNGDASLCHFGREVTPNGHALAEEFVLLDNFYCSGVLSADGHQWTDEAYVTTYLEKAFGGFVRSYPYDGSDALAYAPSGFIWDNALAHGKTFRSYGEMVRPTVKALTAGKPANWRNIYDDFMDDGALQHFEVRGTSLIEAVRNNMCETTIGFPSTVPDLYRAAEFIKELREFERRGSMPNLCVMLLPNDHTTGTNPGYPTPRASVADNDLALGQIIEAITSSRFWPETAIFVCQDDPQAGVDHVDGHRSPAYVISPYTPRGVVESSNYTQVGMVKTIEMILGLPPMNQLDLAAEPMRGCFGDKLDLRPYRARPNQVPLDELNPPRTALRGAAAYWADRSMELDLDEIDRADENVFNRILWFACMGEKPYPLWAATAAAR